MIENLVAICHFDALLKNRNCHPERSLIGCFAIGQRSRRTPTPSTGEVDRGASSLSPFAGLRHLSTSYPGLAPWALLQRRLAARQTYSAAHLTLFKSTPSFAISYSGESSRNRSTVSMTRSAT